MDVKQPAQVKKRESGEDDENEFAAVEEEAFTMVSPQQFPLLPKVYRGSTFALRRPHSRFGLGE